LTTVKHFQSSGLWCLATDFSSTVAGTLNFGDDGLILHLLGSFGATWDTEKYPAIYGIVGENPYGTFVTLVNCVTQRSAINSAGLNFETIRCGRAVIGASHLPGETHQFETLAVSLSYLTDWAGISGISFKPTGDGGFSAHYARPDSVSFRVSDKKLEVASLPRGTHGMHHAELHEETRILIEPVSERSAAELGGGYVQTLQNLLTFATDTPNAIEGVTYYGAQDDQGLNPAYHLVFDPIFRVKEEKKLLHASDMLLTFRDSQQHGINIFENWHEFSERNRGFCTVYFSNLYAEPRYLNDRFASLLQALTLLARATAEVDERTMQFAGYLEAGLKSQYSDDDRALLGHIIPTAIELEMPYRLLRLLQENEETMGTLIDDFPNFVKSVCNTLDYFKRRPEGGQPPLQGAMLLYAMLKIRTLVKLVILKELGFTRQAAKSLIMRNNKIGFLRTV
jgi:ApeA N-terminal domain 1